MGKVASFHSLDRLVSTFSTGDAYLMPSMHKDLLSISQLDKQHMSVLFKGGKCTISNMNDQVVAIGYENHGLYKLDALSITLHTSPAYVSQSLTKEQLWHNRLGHLNPKNIKIMFSKSIMFGLLEISISNAFVKLVSWENNIESLFLKAKHDVHPNHCNWYI